MPKKTIYIQRLEDLEVGDVVTSHGYADTAVEREVPLVLPTKPGTLIKVTWKPDYGRATDSPIFLRGKNVRRFDYEWHSADNRYTKNLVNSITDFEVLYEPKEEW